MCAFFLFSALTIAACGGGGQTFRPPVHSTPTPVPLPSQAPFVAANSQTFAAPAAMPTSVPVPLPTGGGYSGAISLPTDTQSIPTGTTLDVTITDQISLTSGAPAVRRASTAASPSPPPPPAGVSAVVYVSMNFSRTVTLTAPPSLVLALPANFTIPPNTAFWLAMYDPTQSQTGWQLGFEGPAAVDGKSLHFSSTTPRTSFQGGVTYWFMVYAISVNSPTPTPAPSPTPVPVPTESPFSTTQTTTLALATPSASATPVPVAIPTAGGYSGTLSFPVPASGISAGTAISQTLQDTAPSSAPSLQSVLRASEIARTRDAATDSAIVYLSVTFSTTAVFSPAPSLAIVLPSSVPVMSGVSYYLALYDPTNASLGWQLDYEGPASVSGQQLNYASAATPLTFAANQAYWFAVYARSSSLPPPTLAPSPTPGPTPGAILAAPGSFSFLAANVTQSLTISQQGYAGAFTAVTGNTGVATAVATGSATFNVTSVSAGTTALTISNALGQSITIPITVTTTTIPIH
jgi:hypothetical protein